MIVLCYSRVGIIIFLLESETDYTNSPEWQLHIDVHRMTVT